jgi:hypothetical protein
MKRHERDQKSKDMMEMILMERELYLVAISDHEQVKSVKSSPSHPIHEPANL